MLKKQKQKKKAHEKEKKKALKLKKKKARGSYDSEDFENDDGSVLTRTEHSNLTELSESTDL